MEIRSGAEITSNQAQTITVSTQQQLKSSERIYADIAEISSRVKHLIGASESIALNTGTLADKTSELERFLLMEDRIEMKEIIEKEVIGEGINSEDVIGQGKHGD